MPLIELSLGWLVLADAVAWTIFQLGISYCAFKIPSHWFVRQNRLFRSFHFELNGDLWQRLFRIKGWKGRLPEGTIFFKSAYNKQALHGFDTASLTQFVIESRRAELTHWLAMLPAPLFLLWNPIGAFWKNAVYAVLFNLPFILAQRYNRPRLEQLIIQKQNRSRAILFR
ncbi:glycosyl-4,4'-diaponeurosporenoate acyltransferase [Planomicrobium sp. CPCC 101079]|uniref:glycosyl-4,4'-diaponeurosporenoate acyltransferase CrtO family protein n=1 Tax=Planomicrobium sp. CPCC 101079 TaxID=2599618 RepID=UPI0011B61E5E|nr:glycosyl-4,4'-diaponeurosporenoate acyltransferase [Planomicrobium sp. CPCC 101079]TWT01539.1 glycosyl-4,4'-diaponeurosporenoate acyltransferase [Planomicrobium sp. CPCC 101079]